MNNKTQLKNNILKNEKKWKYIYERNKIIPLPTKNDPKKHKQLLSVHVLSLQKTEDFRPF